GSASRRSATAAAGRPGAPAAAGRAAGTDRAGGARPAALAAEMVGSSQGCGYGAKRRSWHAFAADAHRGSVVRHAQAGRAQNGAGRPSNIQLPGNALVRRLDARSAAGFAARDEAKAPADLRSSSLRNAPQPRS